MFSLLFFRFVIRKQKPLELECSSGLKEKEEPKPTTSKCTENEVEMSEFVFGDQEFLYEEEIENSDSNSQESTSSKPERCPLKKNWYKQKYKLQWCEKFTWLKESSDGNSLCVVCNKIISGGITHIKRHDGTTLHKNNFKKAKNTPKINNVLKEKGKISSLANSVKEGELKCVMFLQEHNLPFILMDHLPKLIRSVCPDSEIAKNLKISRTKAADICKNCFTPEALRILTEEIKNAVSFSIILDETTDISTSKSLAVVARYFNGRKVKDRFFGLFEIQIATSESIFNATMAHLEKHGVPVEKLIGLAADNANVMMGNKTGLKALFKQRFPNIFVLGCVCHSFHLCASAAAEKLPKSVEDFARGIYNFFSNSSKRCHNLKECQGFIDEKPRKMLKLSQTRWLSLQVIK